MTQHGFRNVKISDHPFTHGPYRHNVARRPSQHLLGLGAHGKNLLDAP